ncbi:hypothetical protein [Streptomyces sp. NPDC057889]|uniref:hypothetical protein n=1 Tax=Streptomyces sp. NPDC057889 TaxID=3346272 RepID=UPI00369E4CCB
MKLTVQVKLLPTPLQAAALEETLHACNEAATWVSSVAFEKDIKRNFALREHTYTAVKDRWGLGAQAAQHVIRKTCDAYTKVPVWIPRATPQATPTLADLGDLALGTRTGYGLPPPCRTAPSRQPTGEPLPAHDPKDPGEPDHRAGTSPCPN